MEALNFLRRKIAQEYRIQRLFLMLDVTNESVRIERNSRIIDGRLKFDMERVLSFIEFINGFLEDDSDMRCTPQMFCMDSDKAANDSIDAMERILSSKRQAAVLGLDPDRVVEAGKRLAVTFLDDPALCLLMLDVYKYLKTLCYYKLKLVNEEDVRENKTRVVLGVGQEELRNDQIRRIAVIVEKEYEKETPLQ